MDSSSVIAQVSRDENFVKTPSSIPKVETRPPITLIKSNVSLSNKSVQSSLLNRLLCCFRAGISQSSEALHSTNNTYNQNGTFKNTNYNASKINGKCLLKPASGEFKKKICLVVDLDETLVHSSFQPVKNADFIIPVEIDGVIHQVYVLKRPHVDEFLQRIGQLFECVLFTASLGKYADPVTDLLDKWSVFQARLFRESCVFHVGNYVKDLNLLGRDVDKVVIVDNSQISYLFHPKNAVPVTSWFEDPDDHELKELIPFFERLATCDDIYPLLSLQQRHQYNIKHMSGAAKTICSSSLNATFSPLPINLTAAPKLSVDSEGTTKNDTSVSGKLVSSVFNDSNAHDNNSSISQVDNTGHDAKCDSLTSEKNLENNPIDKNSLKKNTPKSEGNTNSIKNGKVMEVQRTKTIDPNQCTPILRLPQQHKTSAPDLVSVIKGTQLPQRHSYQPISEPLQNINLSLP